MRRLVLAGPLLVWLGAGCGAPAAPPFSLKTPKGEVVTSASLRGHVALVYFWASWAPPSRLGLAQVSRVQRAYAARGLTVVTIAVADDPVQVARAAKGAGSNLAVLLGDDGIVRDYFPAGRGDLTLPLTLLLDPRGRVVGRFSGYQGRDDLAPAIEVALGPGPDGSATVVTASQ